MADDATNEEEVPGAKKSKTLLFVIIGVVLLGVAAGAFILLSGGGEEGGGKPRKSRHRGAGLGPTVPMANLVVNLNEPGGTRYLKMGVVMEMGAPLNEKETTLTIKVRDRMIVYLSGLKSSEVLSTQAKVKIKEALKKIANEVFGSGSVEEVYIKEFVL